MSKLVKEDAMKMILALLLVSFGTVSSTIAQTSETVRIGDDDEKTLASRPEGKPPSSRFVFIISGALTNPKELFDDNYNSSYGLSFGIGRAKTEASMPLAVIKTDAFTFFHDSFEFDSKMRKRFNIDEDMMASVSGFHFEARECVPIVLSNTFALSPYLGDDWGFSRFSIRERDFNASGKSTFSELRDENKKIQFSENLKVGFLVTGFDHFALEYSYNFMNVERAFMVWHELIHDLITEGIINGIPKGVSSIVDEEVEKNLGFRLGILAYKIATSVIWYNFDYDNHNWPFDDDPPLRHHKQMLTLNVYF